MSLQNLKTQYHALLTQANTLAVAGFKDSEQRSQFDLMIADSDKLFQLIEREERAIATAPKFNAPPRDGFGSQLDGSKEHEKRAFFQWMRTGSSVGYEQRDLGVGTPSTPITGGNVLVPTTVGPLVDAKLFAGSLLEAVNVLRTADGHQINIPTVNDTSNGLSTIAQAAANSTENDPSFGVATSNVDTATTGLVSISNELLQDAYFDISAWLQQKLAQRWLRGFNQWISQGNSSNVAALSSVAVAGVTSAASGVVAYPDLAALYGSVDYSYAMNGEFIMSPTTRAALMGLVSTTGQPILQPSPNGDPFGSIFGRPIVFDPHMPAIAASNAPIFFGDTSEAYVARIASDFVIKRLEEVRALQNETVFVLYTRVGGVATDAGTHPLKKLTVHA